MGIFINFPDSLEELGNIFDVHRSKDDIFWRCNGPKQISLFACEVASSGGETSEIFLLILKGGFAQRFCREIDFGHFRHTGES